MSTLTQKPSTLARLAEILNAIGMPAHYTAPTDSIPFEKLVVALDNAQATEEPLYLANLYFVEDLLVPAQDLGAEFEQERSSTQTLQIYLDQPLDLNPDKILDTYRMVSILGRWIPVGGSLAILESSEGSSVYYTYAMPTEDRALNANWILDILESLQLFLTGFLPRIHEFQTQDKSLEKVIMEMQRELQGMIQQGMAEG